jgi:hypothetical protein
MRRRPFLLAGLVVLHGTASAADPPRLAVFPLELYDTSGQPPQPEQAARLEKLTAELSGALAASGRYTVLAANSPAGAAIRNCNGCELPEAARLGAELTMSGMVHKVSNLILNMTLTLREAPSGAVRGSWTADFRGNTDESWQRALRWLLRHRVLAPPG